MERVSFYRETIIHVLNDLAEMSSHDDVEILSLFDTPHDNYALIDAGWQGIQRLHHIIAHIHIHSGKIWVEADNTDVALVQQLHDTGVAKDEIVLAFYSPQRRPLTEFAVA